MPRQTDIVASAPRGGRVSTSRQEASALFGERPRRQSGATPQPTTLEGWAISSGGGGTDDRRRERRVACHGAGGSEADVSATYSKQGGSPARSGVKAAALALSLIGSAVLVALSIASPDHAWLRWSAFGGLLPLFVAIRVLRPGRAMLCGALWGLSLYIFCVAVFNTGVSDALSSFALLIAIPAIYAYLAAKLTCWIGFSPFVLGVSWIGVELALEPLGLHTGLLAGTQADGTLIHWLGGALGYVLVAFVVALINAALVSALARVCVPIATPCYAVRSTESGTLLVPQTYSCFPLLVIPPSQPRAPPIPVAIN